MIHRSPLAPGIRPRGVTQDDNAVRRRHGCLRPGFLPLGLQDEHRSTPNGRRRYRPGFMGRLLGCLRLDCLSDTTISAAAVASASAIIFAGTEELGEEEETFGLAWCAANIMTS